MSGENGTGLDVSIFTAVIETGSVEARGQLAAELGELIGNANTPSAERKAAVPSALKLAVDPVADVRRALAEGLVKAKRLDSSLLFTVIADDDDIALPFLARTPVLDRLRMLAILKAGDIARQTVIALRPDIAQSTIDDIIEHRSMDVCVTLFDNPEVRFTAEHYRTLYVRFGQSPEIVERLIVREDLPLDIRVLQTKRASNRIYQLMAERGWVAVNDAADVVADAEESAILQILTNATQEELPTVVSFLTAKKMLIPSIILRAACLGEMRIVEAALAHLADLAPRRVRHMMYGAGFAAFRSLHGKSGLPAGCLALLKAAADVEHEAHEEGTRIGPETFGRRLIEALMTRYERLPLRERAKHLDFVGRLADDRVRIIAKRLKSNLVNAA